MKTIFITILFLLSFSSNAGSDCKAKSFEDTQESIKLKFKNILAVNNIVIKTGAQEKDKKGMVTLFRINIKY